MVLSFNLSGSQSICSSHIFITTLKIIFSIYYEIHTQCKEPNFADRGWLCSFFRFRVMSLCNLKIAKLEWVTFFFNFLLVLFEMWKTKSFSHTLKLRISAFVLFWWNNFVSVVLYNIYHNYFYVNFAALKYIKI